jgi:predicted RNA-binding Zn ribbon-like protein
MPSTPDQPPEVELLLAFANTYDAETGTDDLGSPTELAAWLDSHGLGPARASGSDLELAVAIRDGIRTAMAAHHAAEQPGFTPGLQHALEKLPLRVAFRMDGPRLEPADSGVRGALESVLVAVSDSRADGTWERLKLCPYDDCLVAFFDSSRNRSRAWCSMAVCGNRTKTRAYRQRARNHDPLAEPGVH